MNKGIEEPLKKRRVAWGVTGSGDKLSEILEVMKEMKKQYESVVNVEVYLSKAAQQVVNYYHVGDDLKLRFGRVIVEVNSNSPFLAGWLQAKKYEFLLVAPATSNTVAKIAVGIADTLLTNAAIMAMKAAVPAYIMPCDNKEGSTHTKLPGGQDMILKVRKEDADNVTKLRSMESLFLLENPKGILEVFKKHFESA